MGRKCPCQYFCQTWFNLIRIPFDQLSRRCSKGYCCQTRLYFSRAFPLWLGWDCPSNYCCQTWVNACWFLLFQLWWNCYSWLFYHAIFRLCWFGKRYRQCPKKSFFGMGSTGLDSLYHLNGKWALPRSKCVHMAWIGLHWFHGDQAWHGLNIQNKHWNDITIMAKNISTLILTSHVELSLANNMKPVLSFFLFTQYQSKSYIPWALDIGKST